VINWISWRFLGSSDWDPCFEPGNFEVCVRVDEGVGK